MDQATVAQTSIPQKMSASGPPRRRGVGRFLPPSFSEKAFENTVRTGERSVPAMTDDVGDAWRDVWAYKSDLQNEMQVSGRRGFYGEVYRRVDSNLIFDSILAEYNRFGEVRLKFAVDHEGRLIESSLRAQALDRVLKVRAVWALREALETELAPNLKLAPPGPYWMGARFIFAKSAPCRRLGGHSSAMLTFCRSANEEPVKDHVLSEITSFDVKAEESLDPVTKETDPASGGKLTLNINFSLEQIQRYKRKKYRKETGFDPFVRERNDRAWNL